MKGYDLAKIHDVVRVVSIFFSFMLSLLAMYGAYGAYTGTDTVGMLAVVLLIIPMIAISIVDAGLSWLLMLSLWWPAPSGGVTTTVARSSDVLKDS